MEPDDGICLSTLLLEVDVDPAGVVAGFERAIGTVPRSGSNLSQLSLASNASTVQFDDTSHGDPFMSVVAASQHSIAASPSSPCGNQLLLIEVFCTFNGWIVRIEYPTTQNGWTYRADLGGHSQHRWEFGNVMILMARHSTCGRAVFPRSLCRNCVMKTVWRRECIEPCNTFYLQGIHTVQVCIDALRPLVHDAIAASEVEAAAYLAHAPKPSVARKRVNDSDVKLARMLKYESALRQSLIQGQGGIVVHDTPRSFLAELGNELDRKDAGSAMPPMYTEPSSAPVLPMLGLLPSVSPPPMTSQLASTSCVVPSPQRVVIASPSPHRAISAPVMSSAGVLMAQPLRQLASPLPLVVTHDAVAAYDAFLQKLVAVDTTTMTMALQHCELLRFLADYPNMKTTYAMLASSDNLTLILQSFGVESASQVLVKSTLSDWIGDIVTNSVAIGLLGVSIGFYVAPSASVYHGMFSMPVVPKFVLSATHRIDKDYAAASARAVGNSVRPILVAYYGGAYPMIPGGNLLPLGIAHSVAQKP